MRKRRQNKYHHNLKAETHIQSGLTKKSSKVGLERGNMPVFGPLKFFLKNQQGLSYDLAKSEFDPKKCLASATLKSQQNGLMAHPCPIRTFLN